MRHPPWTLHHVASRPTPLPPPPGPGLEAPRIFTSSVPPAYFFGDAPFASHRWPPVPWVDAATMEEEEGSARRRPPRVRRRHPRASIEVVVDASPPRQSGSPATDLPKPADGEAEQALAGRCKGGGGGFFFVICCRLRRAGAARDREDGRRPHRLARDTWIIRLTVRSTPAASLVRSRSLYVRGIILGYKR